MSENLTNRLKEILVTSLNLPLCGDQIRDDMTLFGPQSELKLDSLDAVDFIINVEQEFNIELPRDITHEQVKTLSHAAAYLKSFLSA